VSNIFISFLHWLRSFTLTSVRPFGFYRYPRTKKLRPRFLREFFDICSGQWTDGVLISTLLVLSYGTGTLYLMLLYSERVRMCLSDQYVKLVPRYTLQIFAFLLPTLSPNLTFPFSTASASLKRMMMVDLEGPPPHSAAVSLHKVSKLYYRLLFVACAPRQL
jgi:hypothetical protein